MKTILLKNIHAAIAALFIAMLAMPTTAKAENFVTIDGVKKDILSVKTYNGTGDPESFAAYLFLSEDGKEYVAIKGNVTRHTYNDIDLTQKEAKDGSKWCWSVEYTKEGYGHEWFVASGNPSVNYVTFSYGRMRNYGDPRPSYNIFGLNLDGTVKDDKHGDGREHKIRVMYRTEYNGPHRGEVSFSDVGKSSVKVSWTPARDETTPQDKIFYEMWLFWTDPSTGGMKTDIINVGKRTSYNIDNLKPSVEYKVELLGFDESGNSTGYEAKTFTTSMEKYNVWIAGTQLTSKNCRKLNNIPGVSGRIKYDEENNTLILNNASIIYDGEAISTNTEDMNIEVWGGNKIEAGGFSAIRWDNSTVVIEGEGSLEVSAKSFGLYAMLNSALIINNCEVISHGSVGTNNRGAVIRINNGSLTATARDNYGSICGVGEFVLNDAQITRPSGAVFDPSLHGVALNGKLVRGEVRIEKVTDGIEAVSDSSSSSNESRSAFRRGIFTLQGVRLGGELQDLPKGVYIVDGKKVIKR